MNLHRLLKERESRGTPLRVGLIGAGKFGSMYLSQVRHTPGMRVTAIADLEPARARVALQRVGWPDSATSSVSFFSDARALIEQHDIDILQDRHDAGVDLVGVDDDRQVQLPPAHRLHARLGFRQVARADLGPEHLSSGFADIPYGS